jgi:uncharacterized protein YndB with AHSA1/START domain
MASTPAAHGQVFDDGDYATIVFKRMLDHTPDHIWSAITEPDELKEWLMATATIDARSGGSIEMISGPGQYRSTGKILTWDPPKVFEYEWKVGPAPEMPRGEDAVFRYELTPVGSGTLLTVEYRRITKATSVGFAPGTHVLLDRLQAQLDQRPLPAWEERFAQLRAAYPAWKK